MVDPTCARHRLVLLPGENLLKDHAKDRAPSAMLVWGPSPLQGINGTPVADLNDAQAFQTHPRGFIGLQVHGIKAGSGPYTVAWRNIRIRPQ